LFKSDILSKSWLTHRVEELVEHEAALDPAATVVVIVDEVVDVGAHVAVQIRMRKRNGSQ